jgi:exodeoxyribonuclease-3
MLSVLTVNIGAAAAARAERILRWLADRDDDVLILTETSAGPGTALILDRLRRGGYTVTATPPAGDRAVAVATRLATTDATPQLAEVSIPSRVAAVTLGTQPPVTVVGVYVPSRDRSTDKTAKKRTFLASLHAALRAVPAPVRATTVLGGDFNVISRAHRPIYRGFLDFEYDFLDQIDALGLADAHHRYAPGEQVHSWVGRTGDGYRYDYLHTGSSLAGRVTHSAYLHETRQLRLTDHAAVTLGLDIPAPRPTTIRVGLPDALF